MKLLNPEIFKMVKMSNMTRKSVSIWINSVPKRYNTSLTGQGDGVPQTSQALKRGAAQTKFLICKSKEMWLPSKPELNPMDFSLWSILGKLKVVNPLKVITILFLHLKIVMKFLAKVYNLHYYTDMLNPPTNSSSGIKGSDEIWAQKLTDRTCFWSEIL